MNINEVIPGIGFNRRKAGAIMQDAIEPDPSDLYKARLEQRYDDEEELLEEESEDGETKDD